MDTTPVNLSAAFASFEDVWSPRIVAHVNAGNPLPSRAAYDVKIAHAKGDHVWHVHEDTDEFFLVLDGRFDIAMRSEDGAESTVELRAGDTFVVPKGVEHKPSSAGATILMFEPAGTSSTGDRQDGEIPDNVTSTAGRDL